MNEIPKLRGRAADERTRAIWQGIVDYANADFTSERAALPGFRRLVFNCMYWLHIDTFDMSIFGDLTRYAKKSGGTLEQALQFRATQYQPAFRSLLTWLCVPDRRPDLGLDAVRLLHLMNEGIHVGIGDANDNFDETGNIGYPIYFFPRLDGCESVLSPICRFLVQRIWEFQDGDLTRIEAIPIRICDRAWCNRFKLPERQKDACFCSDRCRSLHHQANKPREAKAAYMQRYRKTLNARRKAKQKAGRTPRRGGRE